MRNAITPQELEDAADDDGMVINCKMYAQRNSRNLRVCTLYYHSYQEQTKQQQFNAQGHPRERVKKRINPSGGCNCTYLPGASIHILFLPLQQQYMEIRRQTTKIAIGLPHCSHVSLSCALLLSVCTCMWEGFPVSTLW